MLFVSSNECSLRAHGPDHAGTKVPHVELSSYIECVGCMSPRGNSTNGIIVCTSFSCNVFF